jgi:hypothetical protein
MTVRYSFTPVLCICSEVLLASQKCQYMYSFLHLQYYLLQWQHRLGGEENPITHAKRIVVPRSVSLLQTMHVVKHEGGEIEFGFFSSRIYYDHSHLQKICVKSTSTNVMPLHTSLVANGKNRVTYSRKSSLLIYINILILVLSQHILWFRFTSIICLRIEHKIAVIT